MMVKKTIGFIGIIAFVSAISGCGNQPAPHPSSALADDEWYRPLDQSVFSSFGGGQQSAPLEEGFYFDQTASGSQNAYVLGAADDMGSRILSFAASAPPHSRIEVYGTSDSPGQPEPIFEYESKFLTPEKRKIETEQLKSQVEALKKRVTSRHWLKWSPVLEDAHFVSQRAGQSGMRSHVYVYSDLEQFTPSLTTARIFAASDAPGHLVSKTLETMPKLKSAPEKLVAIRWPGYTGPTPLTAAKEDALSDFFTDMAAAWGSKGGVYEPGGFGVDDSKR